jgi:signal transduction histidine kinase
VVGNRVVSKKVAQPAQVVPSIERVHLDIHPSVVFKLGEDLISDDVQALMELIKNSWDADATSVKITIDTTQLSDSPGSDPGTGDLVGLLRVVDNGNGMSHDDIVDGWLVVSNSTKKAFKQEGKTTGRGRTPLGDKGLGRLGTQRLGKVVSIATTPRGGGDTLQIDIPWVNFEDAAKLGDVTLDLERLPRAPHPGTTLTIRGLNSPVAFRDPQELERLRREFAWLLSPYSGRPSYSVGIEIDGKPLDVGDAAYDLKPLVQIHYSLAYAQFQLSVVGALRLDFFSPGLRGETQQKTEYAKLMRADRGQAFAEWFMTTKANMAKRWSLTVDNGRPWYFAFAYERRLEDIPGAKYLPVGKPATHGASNRSLADPGPFTGEVGAFAVEADAELKKDNPLGYLREIAGIHVYRDGFGIRMGEDWIGLGKRWSSGTSFYNLRPKSVLGHIDLSAAHNGALEEMSDREGLKSSPYVDNFKILIEDWRKFTEEVQGGLRRAYNEWKQLADVPRTPELEEPQEITADSLSNVLNDRLRRRQKEAARMSKSAVKSRSVVDKLMGSLDGAGALPSNVSKQLGTLAAQMANLEIESEALRVSASEDEAINRALKGQLEKVEEQVGLLFEAVALGLSAEGLTHEVAQASARLSERSRQTQTHLKALGPVPPAMTRYLSEVRATAAGLNRQLAHFIPALRFARERRETLGLGTFCRDMESYYNDRWSADPIPLRVRVAITQDFALEINRGRMTQVLDNLILNAEFWQRSIRTHDGEMLPREPSLQSKGEIHLEIDDPFLRVWDDGPGVEPAYEDTLFEPFMTAKRDADGRGLGLYISRRLLEAEHITLDLLQERNALGRRFVFALDCSAANRGRT